MSALLLLTAWRNICSYPGHCRWEIPALILLTVWRNVCSLPAHWMLEILALILLTLWGNIYSLPAHWIEKYCICSHPAYCTEECLLSSYSLVGEIPALILLTEVDLCSLPAHYMEKYLFPNFCSLYGGISLSSCWLKGTWQRGGFSEVFAEIGTAQVPYTTFQAVPVCALYSRRYS